jgi:cysteine sulfinate desulfinase/cysteine desulfurase-like protein
VFFWLLVWQIAAMLMDQPLLLVSPLDTLKRLCSLALEPIFWKSIAFSVGKIMLGFGLSCLMGIVLAALAYRFRPVRQLLSPLTATIKAIPVASFVILALLWVSSKNLSILISVMMINNEIGTIEPIKELAAVAKKHGILFHTDAVQALANMPIDVKEMGIDLMSMSAHKIYGPKGIGALYMRKGLRLPNFIHGGAQEMGRRAGTENLPSIVGFGKAAEMAQENLDSHISHCKELRDYLVERITTEIPDTFVNGTMEARHPGNANITFKYIEGESILLLLDYKGVSVSTGSAVSGRISVCVSMSISSCRLRMYSTAVL